VEGDLNKYSSKRFTRNPFTNTLTSISSLGFTSLMLTSQNLLRNYFKVLFCFYFISNMSPIWSCFGQFTANHSKKTWENATNEVMDALGILLHHFRVVPASVPTNILQRIVLFPPDINIWARNALRWAYRSPSPVNGITLGIT